VVTRQEKIKRLTSQACTLAEMSVHFALAVQIAEKTSDALIDKLLVIGDAIIAANEAAAKKYKDTVSGRNN